MGHAACGLSATRFRNALRGAGGLVPAATVIQSVDSATQVTLSANATGSSTVAMVFAPYGVGDGSTTFGLPNLVYAAVGRDNAGGAPANVLQVSTTFSITSGTAAATVASATGLFVGMYASAPKIPSGTKISAISGTSVTLSANATGTVSAGAIRFSPVLDAQTLGAVGGALSNSTTLVTANLPAYTPTGTINEGTIAITGGTKGAIPNTTAVAAAGHAFGDVGSDIVATQTGSTFTGTAQGGTATPIVKGISDPKIVITSLSNGDCPGPDRHGQAATPWASERPIDRERVAIAS